MTIGDHSRGTSLLERLATEGKHRRLGPKGTNKKLRPVPALDNEVYENKKEGQPMEDPNRVEDPLPLTLKV